MAMILQRDVQRPPPPPAAPAPRERGFFAQIPGCLAYPLRKSGAVQLLLGALLLWIASVAARYGLRGFAVTGALLGYFATYLLVVANESGDGREELPHWPGLTHGLAANFGMLALTVALSLLPIVGYVAAMIWLDAPFRYIVLVIYASLFFLPMALMRVSMLQTLEGINPFQVVRSIGRVLTPYMGLCLVLTFLQTVYLAVEGGLALIPYAGDFLGVLTGFYAAIVGMRLLGLFYFVHRRQLDWFSAISST